MPKKLSIDYIKEELKKENYYLEPNQVYHGSDQPLITKCCNGHIYNLKWEYWKNGNRCPSCSGNNIKNNITFISKELNKDGYSVLEGESYINNKTAFMGVCNRGHKIKIRYNDWTSGYRCMACSGSQPHTIDDICKKLESELYYLEPGQVYKNNKTKLYVKCNNGHSTSISYNDWSDGHRCRQCWLSIQESKGVLAIKKMLNAKNITFCQEYSYDNCRNVKKLHFDFAIKINSNVIGLIEFNGEQHYKSIDFFGGNKSFLEQQKRDEIKVSYCTKVNIPLLVIPYFEYKNCEAILVSFLKSIGVYV